MPKQKPNLRLKILFGLLLLSVVAWVIYFFVPQPHVFDLAGSVLERHPKYFSHLNGLTVTSAVAEAPAVVAVMIDNHPDAYVQSCLGGADDVVYEAPVEGVTTRFMQVMNADSNLPKVGPVRSARPYYLDWLAEYGDSALYMHCGGAPEALQLIKTRKIFDANEFYWGPYYWRDNQRIAPHNLYTSHEKWTALLGKYSISSSSVWSGWKFSQDISADVGAPVKEISIKYYPGYQVTWRYNQNNTLPYERYVNGNYHRSICSLDPDALAFPISSNNVLVQFVQMETIDEVGRKEIKTTGSGDAYVSRNGLLITATWKKEDVASRTRFYDKNNQEISLAPGNTWVQVVPVGTPVEISN